MIRLPLSLPEIAYAKIIGALFALVPAVFYFCLGCILDAEDFVMMLGDMFEDPEWFLLIGLYAAYLLLLGHLTTYLSLLSNAWAGALLGIVATVMGIFVNYMAAVIPVMLIQFGGGGPASWGQSTIELYMAVAGMVSMFLVLLLVGCLHMLIGARLKSAAAQ